MENKLAALKLDIDKIDLDRNRQIKLTLLIPIISYQHKI